jgi:hypothetical protein
MNFRKTDKGQIVFAALAAWILVRLEQSGLTLRQWQALDFKLSAIGAGKTAALRELQPKIPDAHIWYNGHGDSARQYRDWPDFWRFLSNRAYFFFHAHVEGGGIVARVAEWPGEVSPDGLLLLLPSPTEGEEGAVC